MSDVPPEVFIILLVLAGSLILFSVYFFARVMLLVIQRARIILYSRKKGGA